MAKLLSTDPTPANQAKALTLLADTPCSLAHRCHGLTDEQARRPPKPDERSIVAILAHLLTAKPAHPKRSIWRCCWMSR